VTPPDLEAQAREHDSRGFSFAHWTTDAHDGPGWYYWDTDYPDEGSVGSFATKEECVAHAADAYPGDDNDD
jgi:hypothetical protein